jgi:hypothetical protein
MSSCEKCWSDSYLIARSTGSGQPEVYSKLVKSRKCTPEEQAGEDSEVCKVCNRKTIHQITRQCMNPDCIGPDNDDIQESDIPY